MLEALLSETVFGPSDQYARGPMMGMLLQDAESSEAMYLFGTARIAVNALTPTFTNNFSQILSSADREFCGGVGE